MKKVIIVVITILVVIGAILGISILLGNKSETEQQENNEGKTAQSQENNNKSNVVTNDNTNRNVTNTTGEESDEEKDEENTISSNKKILVAYFSKTQNTQTIANLIHENVGGDIFRIQTVQSYPTDYTETTQVAKKEQEENSRPELTDKVENMDQYDTIFIGYPNWWGTMPMAVFTFLEQYDFSGKNIIPFCTHEGSALGRSESDIKKTVPNANLLKGLAIRGSSVNSSSAKTSVTNWIEELGIK